MSDHGLADLAPPGAAVSALAVDDAGRVLAARTPDRAVAPASNAKLVTAALALDELGADFRFETELRADGPDLRLVGSGAPDLSPGDCRALADDVAGRVDRVDGDLVLDTSLFEGSRHAPGRTRGDARHVYGAPTTALSLAGNTVGVTVERDGEGSVAVDVEPEIGVLDVEVDPSVVAAEPDGDVDSEATDDDGEAADDDVAGETPDDNVAGETPDDDADVAFRVDAADGPVRVTGRLPAGGAVEGEAPVRRPLEHVGAAMRAALADAGVDVAGDVVVDEGRSANAPAESANEQPLATVESVPLSELLRTMNRDSDNVVADAIARAVAAHATGTGSWDAWSELATTRLGALGVETVRLRDGSGLSRDDRLPARGLVALLRWTADAAWGSALYDSLPAPGEGTLQDRLEGVPVVAKTGTLTGVRALSGRIDRADGPVFFSLLVGDVTVEEDTVRDRLDDVVRSLAGN